MSYDEYVAKHYIYFREKVWESYITGSLPPFPGGQMMPPHAMMPPPVPYFSQPHMMNPNMMHPSMMTGMMGGPGDYYGGGRGFRGGPSGGFRGRGYRGGGGRF